MHSCQARCRIITGERDAGKTTRLLEMVSACSCPQGFACVKYQDGYLLRNLSSGEERLFMSSSPVFTGRIGRWFYDEDLFRKANSILEKIDKGTVFIDEIGRLELSGGGFAPSLEVLLHKEAELTITVRRSFLQQVMEAFGISEAEIIEVGA